MGHRNASKGDGKTLRNDRAALNGSNGVLKGVENALDGGKEGLKGDREELKGDRYYCFTVSIYMSKYCLLSSQRFDYFLPFFIIY